MRKRIVEQVDSLSDEIISFLRELVRTPSDNPPGKYEEISKLIADRYEAMGFDEVKVIKVPEEKVRALGLETPRINVLGVAKGSVGKPVLVLDDHMDAVPPGEGWTINPYSGEVKNGWLYGRGACDAKSNIAVRAYTVVAARRAGVKLKGDAVVAATVDEETGGSLGTRFLLDEGILKPDMAIVEGKTRELFNATNGVLWIEAATAGKAAYLGTPEYGVDAIGKMYKVMSALYEYGERLKERKSKINGIKYPTLVISSIKSESRWKFVCDRCTISFDRRITPEEKTDEVEKELEDLFSKLIQEDPELNLLITRKTIAKPSGPTPEDHPLVATVIKNARDILGEKPQIRGMRGFADTRFFWERGIPFIMYGGDQGERVHGPDERVKVEEVINGTKILALSIADLLS